jgi:membrane associated rhomboid family serine protease/Flp pilus assembly protein TadD
MANCIRCGRQLPPLSFKKICQWCAQHEAAQRGGDSDDERQVVIPAPWVRGAQSSISLTQILFGANIAVFLAMVLASGYSFDFSGATVVRYGANYGPFTLAGQWWRLATYMFLHGGILHIAFNMWCLWDLGAMAESLYGRWTFAAIYLITGIGGGLASVGWNPGVLSVGASGAIFGLAGALIASFYLGEFSLPREAIGGTLRSLLIFAGFNLFFGSMFGAGIDNACHIGGLVSGLALGALIARFAPQPVPMRRLIAIGIVALALLGCAFGVSQWRGGRMRILEGRGGDSIARLQALVRQQPNLAQAHFQLARAYFDRQQFPEAVAEFKRVVELEPQSEGARFNLGMAYLSQQHDEEANGVFKEMIAQNSGSAEGHYGLGLVLADQDKQQAALDEFKAAEGRNPPISGLSYMMGKSYFQLKMYDEAVAAYLKEKSNNGDDPDLENALASAYEAKDMTQQAQQARDKAMQLKAGDR